MRSRAVAAVCGVMMAASPVMLGGCYQYTYPTSAPVPGDRVSLELNDQGRAALAEHVGPGIARVEGWLTSVEDSAYTLRVERTIGVTGATVPWNGELAVIGKGFVGVTRDKQFSMSRTIALTGALAAGFVMVATRGFGLASGFGGDSNSNGGGTNAN